MNAEWIGNRLSACGIEADTVLAERLMLYFDLLNEWNKLMDLTNVQEPQEMVDRHFVDSLTVLREIADFKQNTTLIDVGTGAGFPGLPIAMACPDMQVTLLDAQQKRLNFLQAVIDAAGLNNVRLVHTRAEDGARDTLLREKYDVAVARAVAPLNVLAEYLLPFVRIGGKAVCWKGPSLIQEAEAGKKAAFLCGGKLGESIPAIIPGRDWQHNLVVIEKKNTTSRIYPRKAGMPSKKPLGV